MSLSGKTVGFIGSGNMAEALIRGLLRAGLVPAASIHASDVSAERRDLVARQYGIHAGADNVAVARAADVLVLAVKPQIMAAVVKEIAPQMGPRALMISIAAGVPTASIRDWLGKPARLIRVMPNTPALVLEGVTAIARAQGLEPGDLETAQAIFGAIGRVVVLGEEQLDAVTGLSGSGPAYVAILIEALADGGVRVGLDRATALTLAAQTVLGAARLVVEQGLHPALLKDMVSSPGGTTIAGIAALEARGFRGACIAAVEQATQRSRELGRGGA